MTCKCATNHAWNLAEGEEIPAICKTFVDDGEICWRCGHVEACHPHPILVWRWQDAPDEYQALSEYGGDEDWVAFVPDGMFNWNCKWLIEPCFGNKVSEYQVDGGIIVISVHT